MFPVHRTTLAGLVLALGAASASADNLDKALLQQAPRITRYLVEHGWKNAGVLKFQVEKGESPPTDNVGTLNLSIAQRLELALILSLKPDSPQLGIIRDASAVAARTAGANHLTPEGRRKLFDARYPLAWGKTEVAADAFLTGVVKVDAGLRELGVKVHALARGEAMPQDVVDFRVVADSALLPQTGASFLTRGLFEDAQREAAALSSAESVQAGKQVHPLADPEAPIELDILYDGQPVRPEVREAAAGIPEPAEGQKVAFVLRRGRGADPRTIYGVVLKINGENTIYRQRLPDDQCLRWVLDPGDGPVLIAGFQSSDEAAREFRVASRAESKANEFQYGADVGLISLAVFRGKRTDEPLPELSDEARDQAALTRGLSPESPPRTLAALKALLRRGVPAAGETTVRGLVAESDTAVASAVRRVEFRPEPVPVMTAVIRYYKP